MSILCIPVLEQVTVERMIPKREGQDKKEGKKEGIDQEKVYHEE